jgi:hypothetical protein
MPYFWFVAPRRSTKNRRLERNLSLHHQGEKNQLGENNIGSMYQVANYCLRSSQLTDYFLPDDGSEISQKRLL